MIGADPATSGAIRFSCRNERRRMTDKWHSTRNLAM